jgi:hypothetical protein
MKQKNVKFAVSKNETMHAIGKLIGVIIACGLIGFSIGLGVHVSHMLFNSGSQYSWKWDNINGWVDQHTCLSDNE